MKGQRRIDGRPVHARTALILVVVGAMAGAMAGALPLFATPAPIVLDDSRDWIAIGAQVEYLEDPAGKLSFEEVREPRLADQFRRSDREVLDFGNTSSAYWVRFTVRNDSRWQWYLHLDNWWMSVVDAWVDVEGAAPVHWRSGIFLP